MLLAKKMSCSKLRHDSSYFNLLFITRVRFVRSWCNYLLLRGVIKLIFYIWMYIILEYLLCMNVVGDVVCVGESIHWGRCGQLEWCGARTDWWRMWVNHVTILAYNGLCFLQHITSVLTACACTCAYSITYLCSARSASTTAQHVQNHHIAVTGLAPSYQQQWTSRLLQGQLYYYPQSDFSISV